MLPADPPPPSPLDANRIDDGAILEIIALAEDGDFPEWEYQLRLRDRRGERTLPLERRAYGVGRAADSALLLDDPAVGEHALRAWGGRCGLWVAPCDERHPDGDLEQLVTLYVGESLNVGGAQIRVELRPLQLPADGDFRGIVGRSPKMLEIYKVIEIAAKDDLAVVVLGETGTGKEAVARALHTGGPRASGPFVTLNCAELNPTLAEGELFGAEKGAYTDAGHARAGLFERAHGGTLFLDEIGELPLGLQAKLLRVLQEGEVRRLGGGLPRKVNVRLVAATHRDLEVEVEEGRFRSDLFHRIYGFVIELPPLAERGSDRVRLCHHFLRKYTPGGETVELSQAALYYLCTAELTGNVRELEMTIRRAMGQRCGAPVIELEHLWVKRAKAAEVQEEVEVGEVEAAVGDNGRERDEDSDEWLGLTGLSREEMIELGSVKALRRAGGNASVAAKEFRVHRNYFTRFRDV